MCFENRKKGEIAKKASRNIVTYKALNERVELGRGGKRLVIESPCYSSEWSIGKQKTARMKLKNENRSYIQTGLHSGRTVYAATEYGCNVYICRIPKGAMYYTNDEEYVSNKLIVIKKYSGG